MYRRAGVIIHKDTENILESEIISIKLKNFLPWQDDVFYPLTCSFDTFEPGTRWLWERRDQSREP